MTVRRYPHSCPSCRYIGEVLINGSGIWEIYRCGETGVVFRWGPEGADHFACQIGELPVNSFRDHDRVAARFPTQKIINDAWAMAQALTTWKGLTGCACPK